MINQTLSPTDQLKLQKLQSSLKQKYNRLYLIALDSQNLCKLFIQFLESEVTEAKFVIHNLYSTENSKNELEVLQLNRDGFVDDIKRHIFILNYKDTELLQEKGDFTSKTFFVKFSDNSPATKIENDYFDTQQIYEMVEVYQEHHDSLSSEQKRMEVEKIAFNANRLMLFELSLEYFLILLDLIGELEDALLYGMSHHFIGNNYRELNHYQEAKEHYDIALKYYQKENDQEEIANIYDELGYLHKLLNDFEQSKRYYHQSIQLNQKLGFHDDLAQNYTHLGVLHSELGEYEEAVEYFMQSKTIHTKYSNPVGIADNINNIGLAYYFNGYIVESLKYFNEALEYYDREQNIR